MSATLLLLTLAPLGSPLPVAAMGSPADPLRSTDPRQEIEAATHLGVYQRTFAALSRPVAAAFGPAPGAPSALWVAESGRGATPPGLRALRFSGEEAGATLTRIGQGVVGEPTGIAVGRNGFVFVTDALHHAVWSFDPDGAIERLARRGSELGEVLLPADVSVLHDPQGVPTELLVVDAGNARVQRYEFTSRHWSVVESEPLVHPSAACFMRIAGQRSVCVVDRGRQKVDVVDLGPTPSAVGAAPRASFSDWGYFPSLISSPGGIVEHAELLFVADTENHRVQVFDATRPGDPVLGFRYSFGIHAIRPGEGDGSLHYPSDLAVTADGEFLAVTEPLDDRVQVFGRGPGEEPAVDPTRVGLGAPNAHLGPTIAASGQYLATVSPESHAVQIHDVRLDQPARVAELFGFGERLGMLREPAGVWLGNEGRDLVVTDFGNRRLSRARLRIAPDEPLNQIPELAVHLDAVGLGRLDPEGCVLPGAVVSLTTDGARRYAVVNRADDSVMLLDDDLALERTIRAREDHGALGLAGLAVSGAGTLLVVDRAGAGGDGERGGRVLEFRPDGTWLRSFGDGVLLEPDAVVCRGTQAFVSDPLRDRVEVFERDEEGAFVHRGGFGEPGLGRVQFHEPRGLTVLGDGRLVVLDHGNHRGQIFDTEGNFLAGFGGRLYIAPLR